MTIRVAGSLQKLNTPLLALTRRAFNRDAAV
jgi:hypothetical protein